MGVRARGFRWQRAIVVAGLVLCGVSARAEDAPSAGPEGLAAGLATVRTLLKDEKHADGLAALGTLLEQHEGAAYARGRRAELVDLVARLAFGKAHPPPDPAQFVSGKLIRYVPHLGKIRIRYTPDTAKDFVLAKGTRILLHPARFAGPFTVEVKGSAYPYEPENAPQIVVAGIEDPKTGLQQSWTFIFGVAPVERGLRKVWMPSKVIRRDGADQQELSSKKKLYGKSGKPYKLTLKVTSNGISASLGSRSIGRASKPPKRFGVFAFSADEWTEVTITGKIEPSWLQAKIDASLQEQKKAFDARFDAAKHLPAWLFEGKASRPERTIRPLLPANLSRPQLAAVDPLHEKVRWHRKGHETEYRKALSAIPALRREQVPESVCAYLAAMAHIGLREMQAALGRIERVLELEPSFVRGVMLRGNVLGMLRRFDEAAGAYEQAAEAEPKEPDHYVRAAHYLLLAGQSDRAQQMTRAAAERGVTSDMLDTLSRTLVKARHGPTWNVVHEHKTTNYHVLSDIDKQTCRKVGQVLEEAFKSYRGTLTWVRRDKTRLFKVYLFRGRGGFMSYLQDLRLIGGAPPGRAAGVYSPLLKQLLIWNLPTRDLMMRTVRHEAFHQYLDRFMPRAPVWLNEGLAEYFENARRGFDGSLLAGEIQRDHVTLLRDRAPAPLERFLEIPHAEFYKVAPHSYAQAWAFVHMLRKGKKAHRERFKALMSKLETVPPEEAVPQVFPQAELADLDAALKAYLRELAAR